jgi:hypothetical protein
MDFITEEVQKAVGLTPEQVEALKPAYTNHIADLQKTWDGKANENAEKILTGAIAKVIEVTKVPRNEGEKVAEYIERASNTHLGTLKTDLENARSEYNQKLKDFKGDEATKAELQKAKEYLDKAKQQLAEFDNYKAKAEKLDPLEKEYSSMKLQVAFSQVKPTFPQTVNPYEAKAKWDEFVKGVQEKYTIELVDGEATCIDKENQYKTSKLKDLVAADANLTSLLQGRKQEGSGAKEKEMTKVENVPFDVPKDCTTEERTLLIRDYLTKQGINLASKDYSEKFAELNKAILAAKK